MRAFVALEMPEELKRELARYISAVEPSAREYRWVKPQNLHLTLRFLGNVHRTVVECVGAGLDGVDRNAPQLSLARSGIFGSSRRARVVWIGVGGDLEVLDELVTTVNEMTARCGVEPEQRAFSAHVTLARARDRFGAPAPELPELPELPAWQARRLVLYQSRLGPGGPAYDELHAVELPSRG